MALYLKCWEIPLATRGHVVSHVGLLILSLSSEKLTEALSGVASLSEPV